MQLRRVPSTSDLRRPRRIALVALVAAAALVGVGCGIEAGEDADAVLTDDAREEQRADEALDIAIEQSNDTGGASALGDMSDEEQSCMDDGWADAGVTARDVLTENDADARIAYLQVVLDCLDDPAASDWFVDTITGTLRLASDIDDLSSGETSCIIGVVMDRSPDPARSLTEADGEGDTELFIDAFDDCLSEEHLAELYGESGTGPQSYGDDEVFDSMQDDCEDGNDRACDLLYFRSSTDSEYERVALTCGGRQDEGDVFCAPETEVDDTGFAPADAPGLAVLATDCEAEDLTACDLLYQIAPTGSDYEDVGFTCAGRVPVGALPDCRTRLG
jgi:hypothetical protein